MPYTCLLIAPMYWNALFLGLQEPQKALWHQLDERLGVVELLVVLAIVLALGAWYWFQSKQNAAKLLFTKNTEIAKQAAEIEQKRQQLIEQAELLAQQSDMLAYKSQKIEESLDYAKQVQDSLLPPNPSFLKIFASHFLVNLPQDIVSGDFCWYTHQADTITVVVADCSGHGVSGAFNTVIINSLIAQVINETNHRTPAELLAELHRRIIKLIPSNQYIDFNIGIKIAIMRINVNSFRMVYAGAKMPLYYITDGVLKILPADKLFVGNSHYTDLRNRFYNRMVRLKKGDKLLLFTDGFQDQFGTDGKFMVKNLRKLLEESASSPLTEQRDYLLTQLRAWQGDEPQTDDVLIFGVEV